MDTKIFQKKIWKFYKEHGRHALPWRKTTNPYRILVSEIMLQQTQVDRVLPKYKEFIKAFPTRTKLANATLKEVLLHWNGLGYNRRGKYLWESVQKGPIPKTTLEALPGVGPYTARAVSVFAYGNREVFIETNIRAVFIHEFFNDKEGVDDKEIFPYIEKTLPKKNIREWYWALMDYGSYLKKNNPNPSRKSKHHAKQSTFKGSLREARGDIVRQVLTKNVLEKELVKDVRYKKALDSLVQEGLVRRYRGYVKITS